MDRDQRCKHPFLAPTLVNCEAAVLVLVDVWTSKWLQPKECEISLPEKHVWTKELHWGRKNGKGLDQVAVCACVPTNGVSQFSVLLRRSTLFEWWWQSLGGCRQKQNWLGSCITVSNPNLLLSSACLTSRSWQALELYTLSPSWHLQLNSSQYKAPPLKHKLHSLYSTKFPRLPVYVALIGPSTCSAFKAGVMLPWWTDLRGCGCMDISVPWKETTRYGMQPCNI